MATWNKPWPDVAGFEDGKMTSWGSWRLKGKKTDSPLESPKREYSPLLTQWNTFLTYDL